MSNLYQQRQFAVPFQNSYGQQLMVQGMAVQPKVEPGILTITPPRFSQQQLTAAAAASAAAVQAAAASTVKQEPVQLKTVTTTNTIPATATLNFRCICCNFVTNSHAALKAHTEAAHPHIKMVGLLVFGQCKL